MLEKIEYGLMWWVSGWFGLIFYWTVLVADLICYTLKSITDYHRDLAKRKGAENNSYYTPRLTIGRLINRFIVSFIPIANIFALFDAAPEVFARFFDWVEKVFNIPLVPDSDSYKQKRASKT